jgi:hypothetical protein
MAQFTLSWNNADVVASSNVINSRALYRYKTVGGVFVNTGFTPSNDLSKTVITVDSPVLDDNKIVEFKVQSICTVNGPTDNDNGIKELIGFLCIVPTITKTETTGTIVISTVGLDITKVKFTLRKASDDTIVGTPTTVNVVASSASDTKTGLVGATNYYWQTELYATVSNVEVKSQICSPYPFTTDTPPVCDPLTNFTITSIEIP